MNTNKLNGWGFEDAHDGEGGREDRDEEVHPLEGVEEGNCGHHGVSEEGDVFADHDDGLLQEERVYEGDDVTGLEPGEQDTVVDVSEWEGRGTRGVVEASVGEPDRWRRRRRGTTPVTRQATVEGVIVVAKVTAATRQTATARTGGVWVKHWQLRAAAAWTVPWAGGGGGGHSFPGVRGARGDAEGVGANVNG